MSIQVKLRGGTRDEHRQFIGENREVTVDTSKKTLRVHDGVTYGGSALATEDNVKTDIDGVYTHINNLMGNISEAHNHDNTYSKLNHNHDGMYYSAFNGVQNICAVVKNGYHGFCSETGGDDGWYRTTRNGLIPYQSGGYSAIGTESWRFNDGWFNMLNTKRITVAKDGNTSTIDFPATVNYPGYIKHTEDNNSSKMRFSVSGDDSVSDVFEFGSTPNGNFRSAMSVYANGYTWFRGNIETDSAMIVCGGKHIYFDGQRPGNAPEGSISFG